MKKSEVQQAIKEAFDLFNYNCHVLVPGPTWDLTDFGLGYLIKIDLS